MNIYEERALEILFMTKGRFNKYSAGKRLIEEAKFVAKRLTKEFPELKKYENRIYNWAVMTRQTRQCLEFPIK